MYKKGDFVKISDGCYKYGVVDHTMLSNPCYVYINPIKDGKIDFNTRLVLHVNEIQML